MPDQAHPAFDIERLPAQADRRPIRAGELDRLLSRMALLNAEDRLLLEMHLEHGVTYEQMARICGVHPSTVARRVRQITRRLLADEYITIVRHRRQFRPDELAVAYDRYLLALGYRAIARRRQLGTKKVRQIIRHLAGKVAQLLRENQPTPPSPPPNPVNKDQQHP